MFFAQAAISAIWFTKVMTFRKKRSRCDSGGLSNEFPLSDPPKKDRRYFGLSRKKQHNSTKPDLTAGWGYCHLFTLFQHALVYLGFPVKGSQLGWKFKPILPPPCPCVALNLPLVREIAPISLGAFLNMGRAPFFMVWKGELKEPSPQKRVLCFEKQPYVCARATKRDFVWGLSGMVMNLS